MKSSSVPHFQSVGKDVGKDQSDKLLSGKKGRSTWRFGGRAISQSANTKERQHSQKALLDDIRKPSSSIPSLILFTIHLHYIRPSPAISLQPQFKKRYLLILFYRRQALIRKSYSIFLPSKTSSHTAKNVTHHHARK